LKALKEWWSGQYCDLSNPTSIQAIQHNQKSKDMAVAYFQKVKEHHPAAWIKLSKDIVDLRRPKQDTLDYSIIPFGIPDHSEGAHT